MKKTTARPAIAPPAAAAAAAGKGKAKTTPAPSAAEVAAAAAKASAPEPQQYGPEGDTYVHRPEEMVVLPTSLPHALLVKLDDFVARFGGRVARRPGPEVTHVVGKADARRKSESRTIKYLHGLLFRRWLLASSWVTDALAAGRLEPEVRHELTGDVKAQDPSAPTKARLSRYKRTPGLLSAYVVATYGDFPPPRPARRDLESLVAAGEGRVVPLAELARLITTAPTTEGEGEGEGPVPAAAVTKYVVLCNSLPAPGSGAAPPPAAVVAAAAAQTGVAAGGGGGVGGNRPQVVNSDWLLDTISNYRPMPFGKYRVVLPEG